MEKGQSAHPAGISIHALREESDSPPGSVCQAYRYFNPRPPRGERRIPRTVAKVLLDFNPRPPRGERQLVNSGADKRSRFQSTPSARRATPDTRQATAYDIISIHALREESDMKRYNVYVYNMKISIHALREESDSI